MREQAEKDLTNILFEVQSGVPDAGDRLLPIVYGEMRGIAGRIFKARHAGNSIQPTILVHDVFMKLTQNTDIDWASRAHFYAVAGKAMRNLLVDHARKRQAAKRGGDWSRITLDRAANESSKPNQVDILDLEEAMKKLGEISPRQEKITVLRFYSGMTNKEIAEVIGVSERTIFQDWRMARAWLRIQLQDPDETN